jgi:hypothetical protein
MITDFLHVYINMTTSKGIIHIYRLGVYGV